MPECVCGKFDQEKKAKETREAFMTVLAGRACDGRTIIKMPGDATSLAMPKMAVWDLIHILAHTQGWTIKVDTPGMMIIDGKPVDSKSSGVDEN